MRCPSCVFVPLTCLAVAAPLCLGARIKVEATCPEKVYINAKRDCLDKATDNIVAADCCDSIRHCHDTIDRVKDALTNRFRVYMSQCGVTQKDLDQGSDGDIVIKDDTRLCQSTCQQIEELHNPVEFDGQIEDLQSTCTDPTSVQSLKVADSLNAMIEPMDVAWHDCSERITPTPAEGTCPDHSMVGYDCGHHGSTKESCEADGCCWDPPARPRPNLPWCYKSPGSVQCEKKCPSEYYDRKKRSDCDAFVVLEIFTHPDKDVRGKACRDVGCCWQPLEENSNDPWCFHTPCVE